MKLRKFFTGFMLAVSMFGLASGAAQEVAEIKIATNAINKPYSYVDEENEITGYDAELVKAIFDRLDQYEIEIDNVDFPTIFSGMDGGLYNMGFGMLSYTEERAENYYYSLPINSSNFYYVHRTEDPITSLHDAGERNANFRGSPGSLNTMMIETYNENNPDTQINVEYGEGSSVQQSIINLETEVTDFSFFEHHLYTNVMEEFDLDDKIDISDVTFESLDGLPEDYQKIFMNVTKLSYFCFPKTDEGEAIRDQVNEVLLEMYEDGSMAELQEEIFGMNQMPEPEEMEEQIN